MIVLLFLSACKTQQMDGGSGDNSRNSVDWIGTYIGTLPCADCEGLKIQIVLTGDDMFEISSLYAGKSDEIMIHRGQITWDASGGIVILGNNDNQFRVGENKLIKLDRSGNKIESPNPDQYTLKKIMFDEKITEKYWKLIELNGKAVKVSPGQQREAYMILKDQENRVNGNGSCNSFFGTYELNGNTLRFKGIGATRMACPDMDAETELFQVLEQVDNFNLKGDTLTLNKGRMAPLARFEVVWLR